MTISLSINSLDLNDGTNYSVATNGFVIIPGHLRQSFADSPNRDGKTYNADKSKVECDLLTFTINVYASSKANLITYLQTLFKELQKTESTISYTPDGGSARQWKAYPPSDVDPSLYFNRSYVEGLKVPVTWTMEAQPRGEASSRTTLTVLEQLAPNGDFENWTGANPDDWTITVGGANTVTEETTEVWHGDTSVKFVADGINDCYITTTDYITVDMTKYYYFAGFMMSSAGAGIASFQVLCYNSSSVLQGTVTKLTGTCGATWLLTHRSASAGVVAPGDFPADTAKVKLKIEFTTAHTAYIDTVHFRESDYLTSLSHKALNPITMNIPASEFSGSSPSNMDIILKSLYWQPSAYIIGQRKPENYSDDFDGVGKTIFAYLDNECLNSTYEIYNVPSSQCSNGNFDSWTGSGNTTDWSNWTESRSSNNGVYLQANPISHDAGSGSVEVSCDNDKNLCLNPGVEDGSGTTPDDWTEAHVGDVAGTRDSVYSDFLKPRSGSYFGQLFADSAAVATDYAQFTATDYVAVDITEKYYLETFLRGGNLAAFLYGNGTAANTMSTAVYIDCYNAVPAATGTVTIYSGKPIGGKVWLRKGGYINPSDWPAGTTQVKIRIRATVDATTQRDSVILFDDFKFHQVSYSFSESLTSDIIDFDETEDVLISLSARAGSNDTRVVPSYCYIDYYTGVPALIESRLLWKVNPGTAWETYTKVIDTTEYPSGTDKIKIRLVREGYAEVSSTKKIPPHLWDSVIVKEDPALAEAEFTIDDHKGRYVLAGQITISAAEPIDSTLRIQGTIEDDTLGDIVEMNDIGSVELGDPAGDWINTAFLDERYVLEIPSHRLSDNATTSNLNQKIRFAAAYDFDDTLDYYFDFVALIPCDQSIATITGLIDEDYVIIDSSSEHPSVLKSLDGTLDTATKINCDAYSNFKFKADPIYGVNLVILALYDNDGSYDVRPVYDVDIVYTPKDFLI